MTKEKYLYELIDRCMRIACLDNIIVENFELRDDEKFYTEIERQFLECARFYDDMNRAFMDGKMSGEEMDMELGTVLNLMRQKLIAQLSEDFTTYLQETNIPKEDTQKHLEILKSELQTEDINADYLLDKIQKFREMEQA